MDPLADTITLLRPRALLWKEIEVNGDWAIRFPPSSGVVFAMIASGSCVLRRGDEQPREMATGDFLLMRGPGSPWVLGRDAASKPREFVPLHTHAASTVRLIRDDQGPVTRVFGGRFIFDNTNATLLEGLLPSIVEIKSLDAGAFRLRHLLDLLGDEAGADRPGRHLVIQTLLQLMLVEAIRTRLKPSEQVDRGLIAGLGDPKIAKALREIHADFQAKWTVSRLAQVAGMSRSVFSERFERLVGSPPIDYLLRWRMAKAKEALSSGKVALSQVALKTGYQSVSAFSTAFNRTVGCPPSLFAERARSGESDTGTKP